MQDVKLTKNADGIYDLSEENGDFATVSGIETSIILSLFTDARTNQGEVEDAYRRQGWAGNLLKTAKNYQLGGELWLVDQARLDDNTINRAENFAYNSLLHLIETGIAEKITIEIDDHDRRGIYIVIELFKGRNLIARYETLWRNTANLG